MTEDDLKTLHYCLDCSSDRMRWYIETRNDRYLEDSSNYLKVADIYMKQLLNTTK